MYEQQGPSSSARVDIHTNDLVTWLDAFQFGAAPGCTGPNWTLTGTFQWDIKANNWNGASQEPSLSLSSNGAPNTVIVVDDPVNLILHANVPPLVLTGVVTGVTGATGPGLLPGKYDHALRLTLSAGGVIEILHGEFYLKHGV